MTSRNLHCRKFSWLEMKISHTKYQVWGHNFKLVGLFRRLSELGWIYNLHFRAFQTFSFRAKKKIENKKNMFKHFFIDLKKCLQYCPRNLDLVRKMIKWTFKVLKVEISSVLYENYLVFSFMRALQSKRRGIRMF